MSVKMPVLGQPARRKSGGLGWVLFLGLALAAGDRLIVLATRAGLSTFLAQNRPPGRYDVTQDAIFFDQQAYERDRNVTAADGD